MGARSAGNPIVTAAQWSQARRALLEQEKELTRLRDDVAAARRALPWTLVETEYRFDTATGQHTLAELFDGRSQLIVYHFMFGTDWDAGCPICSFWIDTLDRVAEHLRARDVTLVWVARASFDRLDAYRRRMGWRLPCVSSAGSEFNVDFGVSFTDLQQRDGAEYNYGHVHAPGAERPGLSVFARREGDIFHTYSTYARGLDAINGAYQLLDLTPQGRDEHDLPAPMSWVRRHDEYDR